MLSRLTLRWIISPAPRAEVRAGYALTRGSVFHRRTCACCRRTAPNHLLVQRAELTRTRRSRSAPVDEQPEVLVAARQRERKRLVREQAIEHHEVSRAASSMAPSTSGVRRKHVDLARPALAAARSDSRGPARSRASTCSAARRSSSQFAASSRRRRQRSCLSAPWQRASRARRVGRPRLGERLAQRRRGIRAHDRPVAAREDRNRE